MDLLPTPHPNLNTPPRKRPHFNLFLLGAFFMADAIQFTVPDDDFIKLAGAGSSGSVLHQGSANGSSDSNIILVEAAVKPTLAKTPNRFKSSPASFYLSSGKSEPYSDATTIWAVSAKGDQLLSVTPSA